MSDKKLNLGSGAFLKEGFVNLDSDPNLSPDVVHNLDEFPYPFPDNHFDTVEADHVLEHLNHPLRAMVEIHRIMKDGGSLTIRVPHSSRGFTHADHKAGFDVTFPYYFLPSFKGGYTGAHFLLQKMRLRWFAQPYLKKEILPAHIFYLATGAGHIIDWFANLFPYLCSRLWCYWVGGFEQIEFKFRTKK